MQLKEKLDDLVRASICDIVGADESQHLVENEIFK